MTFYLNNPATNCSCEMMKERRICSALATGATQGMAAESFYRAEAISHAKGVVLWFVGNMDAWRTQESDMGAWLYVYIYICSLISRYKFILHIYISELFAVELEGTTLSCMDPILLVYNCSLLRLAPEKLRNKLCGLHDAVVVRGPWFSRLFLGDCRLKRAIHKKDMF